MPCPDSHRPIGVLFVCAANVCRSPLAEGIFSQLLEQAGLSDEVRVDSAASGLWQVGSAAHPAVLSMLKANGIEYEHAARIVVPADFDAFHYILGMDNDVLRSIWSIRKGSASVQPFVKYIRDFKLEEVPDPMRTGEFEAAYSVILSGCKGFLAFLRNTHEL
jgi:protein-tyrosine phosphatase